MTVATPMNNKLKPHIKSFFVFIWISESVLIVSPQVEQIKQKWNFSNNEEVPLLVRPEGLEPPTFRTGI